MMCSSSSTGTVWVMHFPSFSGMMRAMRPPMRFLSDSAPSSRVFVEKSQETGRLFCSQMAMSFSVVPASVMPRASPARLIMTMPMATQWPCMRRYFALRSMAWPMVWPRFR